MGHALSSPRVSPDSVATPVSPTSPVPDSKINIRPLVLDGDAKLEAEFAAQVMQELRLAKREKRALGIMLKIPERMRREKSDWKLISKQHRWIQPTTTFYPVPGSCFDRAWTLLPEDVQSVILCHVFFTDLFGPPIVPQDISLVFMCPMPLASLDWATETILRETWFNYWRAHALDGIASLEIEQPSVSAPGVPDDVSVCTHSAPDDPNVVSVCTRPILPWVGDDDAQKSLDSRVQSGQ